MQRSNPFSPARRLDCFAEPVIGRRLAPTRWLAMTGKHLISLATLSVSSKERRRRRRVSKDGARKGTHMIPPSRDAVRPSFARNLSPFETEGAGNAGCPMHPQPGVRMLVVEYAHQYSQRRHRKTSGIPHASDLPVGTQSAGRGTASKRLRRGPFVLPSWERVLSNEVRNRVRGPGLTTGAPASLKRQPRSQSYQAQ